ncbi:Proton pump-interactor 1 [Nymphaea thermarum]|nr:Proton pump-interactor 1 [Nymphaea thermarum]
MTADFREMDAGKVEFEGKRESTEVHKSAGGGDRIVVGEEEELMDDSYVYVDKELQEQSEIVASGEKVDSDRLSECPVEPIKNAELDGVLGDGEDLNSDVAGDAVSEVADATHVDRVSALNAGGGDSNSDGQVHEATVIESSLTMEHGLETDAVDGSLNSNDRVFESKDHESPASAHICLDSENEGVEEKFELRASEAKCNELPRLLDHIPQPRDERMSSDDAKESESPVLVDHGLNAESDGEIIGYSSEERKDLGSPVSTDDNPVVNSESGGKNSGAGMDEVKDVKSSLVNQESNCEVGVPCSVGKESELVEIESVEHAAEVQEIHADAEIVDADVPPDATNAAESMETFESRSETRDLDLDDCTIRKEVVSLDLVDGVLKSDVLTEDKVSGADDGKSVPADDVSTSMFEPHLADPEQVEENNQIEQGGDTHVHGVLGPGLEVEKPISELIEEPLDENMEDVTISKVPHHVTEKRDCSLEIELEKESEDKSFTVELEKEAEENSFTVEGSEHVERAQLVHNSKALPDSCSTIAVESASTSGPPSNVVVNSLEDHDKEPVDVDAEGDRRMEGERKQDLNVTEESACKGTMLPCSASVSWSELHEGKSTSPVGNCNCPSNISVATNVNDGSTFNAEEAESLVSSSQVGKNMDKNTARISMPDDSVSVVSLNKSGEEVQVNGVLPYIPECSVIFGSFSHLGGAVTINGISPQLERSSTSSLSGQSDEGAHSSGTVSNVDADICNFSPPSSHLVDEITTTSTASDGQKLDSQPGRKPVYAIIRIPRPVDNKLKEQIRQAQVQVDDLTQKRDAINGLVQSKQGARHEIWEKLRAAKSELRAARDSQQAKRKEMESIQSAMSRMKTATSVEEYDERILSMQHRLEHETVPLKEEKQLIREIKQLKLARDKLSIDMGRQSELDEVFDRKDEIEGNLKLLEQEFDSIRKELVRTDAQTKAIEKELHSLDEEVNRLRAQVASANDVRQVAYHNLRNLKKQEYEKHTLFYQNRTDIQIAHQHANMKDREAVASHCLDQVERMMDLWNNNDDFRREYIKNNEFSTLRRLGTLDGRALGPDEESLLLKRRAENESSVNQLSLAEKVAVLPSTAAETLVGGDRHATDVNAGAEVREEKVNQKNSSSKTRKSSKSARTESIPTLLVKEELEEQPESEEKKLSEEELQRLRQEEEQRKEEAAARLKEQRRLEEIAKAKEAEARKRRNAEKAKARAEARAQKESERREKEREKRARKKATAATATANGGAKGECAESLDKHVAEGSSALEFDTKERQESAAVAANKPPRSYTMSKSNRPKTLVPPPLRKNRRKMQPWMYALLLGGLITLLSAFMVQRLYF